MATAATLPSVYSSDPEVDPENNQDKFEPRPLKRLASFPNADCNQVRTDKPPRRSRLKAKKARAKLLAWKGKR
jgi:hypothetical protein